MAFSSRRNSRRHRSYRPRLEMLESREMLSASDVTDWQGIENTEAPNDYGVLSAVSAGGTFDARRHGTGQDAAYLADTSLSVTGGTLAADTSGGFGASGTISFDASTNDSSLADPVFYFGFFDRDDLTAGAFGFSTADQTTSSFRFRASAGTTQTSGSGTVVSEGTYTFDLDVNNADSGADKVRFRLFDPSATVLDVSVDIPASGTPIADSFGFLQPVANSGSDVTFGMTVTEINYTGETQVTLPTPPTNLSATTSTGQVSLAWQDNATNETAYTVQRKIESSGAWETIATLPSNSTSYVNEGLSNGTTYFYRVRANIGSHVSDWSNEVEVTTPSAPAAPSNLAATAVQGEITLTWTDNSTNETTFGVERRVGASGAWEFLAYVDANSTSYVDVELTPSTTYYYRINAINDTLASGYSNEASATTPASGSVADVSDFVGVNNFASPNNFLAGTTSFGGTFDSRRFGTGQDAAYLADTDLDVPNGVLTASTSGGFNASGTIAFDASTDDTSLADPVFYFGFFDKDDLGGGAFGFSIANQTTSSFRFRASAGTTQTSGAGTVVSEGTYTFDLDVNNADSGADKVRFRLYDMSTSANVLDVNVTIPPSGTPAADSFGFLQPVANTSASDVTFGMTMSNVNYTGETLVTVPDAPSNLVATAAERQISLTWSDNSADETCFVVERKEGSSGAWAQVATLAADTTEYEDVELADGATYYYRVRAQKGSVASSWSSEANATTLAIPLSPSHLVATAATGEVALSWQDNSIIESGFVIQRKIGGGSFTHLTTLGANVTAFTDSGLTENTTYTYRVLAQNGAGDSGWSNEASAITPATTLPEAPTDLAATAATSQVSLAWSDNSTNETGFSIERRVGSSGTWSIIETTAANATSYVDTDVSEATTYYYRVRAQNGAGSSAYTFSAWATTPASAGVADLSAFTGSGNTSAPNDYTASTTSAGGRFDARRFGSGESASYLADTSLAVTGGVLNASTSGGFSASGTFTFDASSDNASLADPIFYLGFFDRDNLADGAYGMALADSTTSAFRFRASAGTEQTSGLGTVVNEGTYQFRLDVNNENSGTNNVRFRLIDGTSTSLDVSVAIPAGLSLDADSFGFLQPAAPFDSDATFGLTISNINYTGETLISGTITAPTAPSNLAASAGTEQVSITWVDNSSNETSFIIERKVGSGSYAQLAVVGANETQHVDTGLTGGLSYTYRVKAENSAGSSGYSNEASAVPSAAPSAPLAPSNLSLTPAAGQVSLSWTDNSTDEDAFSIERRAGETGMWDVIATVAANQTAYVDETVSAGSTYSYRVRAQNGSLNSEYSNIETATVPSGSTQDSLIAAHGEYSQTYSGSWQNLPTGKEVVQARPAPPAAVNLVDGVAGGVNYKNIATVEDGVATIKDLNLRLSWSQQDASENPDEATVSTLWFFKDLDKVVIDNVTIEQMNLNMATNTIRIWNVDTVEIRNSTFIGDTRLHHIRMERVKNVFIDGVEIKGNAEGYSGGGIYIENGHTNKGTPLGPLEWLVVQNSYFHDATKAGATTDRDALLVHTFNNGAIFNNTFENWVSSSAIDGAIDVSLRAAHPTNHQAILRVERNEFINNTLVKNVGGSSGDSDHHTIWTNNVFLNTGMVDYHTGYTVHVVNNTFVFDPEKKGDKLKTIYPLYWWYATFSPSPVNFVNNIVSQAGDDPFTLFWQKKNGSGGAQSHHLTLTSNHNWFGGTITRWMKTDGTGGWSSTSFSDWNSRGYDTDSELVVFDFVDYADNDFSLDSEPVSSFTASLEYTLAEQTLVGLQVTRDFRGLTRDSNPTVGAYEYAP